MTGNARHPRFTPDDVTVVIPCMNEEQSLARVLAGIPPGHTALVVDNNSTDGTAAVARAHGATAIHDNVPGYGSAVNAGVEATATTVVCARRSPTCAHGSRFRDVYNTHAASGSPRRHCSGVTDSRR